MAEHKYFDHRSEKTGDWPNKMVRDAGYVLPPFFSDMANQVESIAAGMPGAATALQLLIRDEGVDPPDHRSHLLGDSEFHRRCREIGVGFATNPATTYGSFWVIHATWSAADACYLTGVVYEDDPTGDSPARTLVHVERDNVHVEFVQGEPRARVGFRAP